MISAIFQNETTALESQVATLQAQIAAHTARIALLNDAEFLAGDSLQSLKSAIQKGSSLAPSAVSNLRAAVLNLFTGNDSTDDGNGNEPQPSPQPDDDGQARAVETLNGQHTEWASPWACPLASPLACSLEIAAPLKADEPQQPYIELIAVGHSVAYQRRAADGEIICAYLGGKSKARLQAWGESLCLGIGSGFELREAKRLTAYKWEIKIWGLSDDQIHNLASSDLTIAPTLDLTASHPVPEVESHDIDPLVSAALTAELSISSPDPEAHTFQIGNKVKIVSDRHNTLNQLGLITAATTAGAAVNVGGVMRWFCSDELVLVEAAAPRKPIDDLFTTNTPRVTATSVYSANPIGRRGAAANWEILQAKRAMEREQKTAALAIAEPDF